jgi:TetR/AcrR family transcriptional regulator
MPSSVERPSTRVTPGERRRRLLDSARRAFLAHGFAGATTRQIARDAGTTETVMYRHFASKEELFDAAIGDPLEQLMLRMAALATQFTTVEAQAQVTLSPETQERMLVTMLDAIPLFGAAVLNHEDGARYYARRIAPLVDLASKAIAEGLESFPNTDVDPAVFYCGVLGIHMGLAIEAFRGGAQLDIPAVARQITDLLTNGLARR